MRNDKLFLTDNRQQGMNHLNKLKRRFDRNQRYKDDYVELMTDLMKGGCAERAPEQPKSVGEGRT